jgi:L-threonylcarbamoyladenylate synthase
VVTQIWHVDSASPDPTAVNAAAAILRAGGLVAFPTETVYGLGANALDAAAVARIFLAKERPASDPVIVHVHEMAQLALVAVEIPPLAYILAERFWPGPLTLVLRRAAVVPASVSAGRDTVAVRMPGHPVALALLKAAQVPVAAPSANRFARPSATTADHVREDLDGRIEGILDAGSAWIGVESTILDLTKTVPMVLRPGGVPVERLREMLPDLEVVSRHLHITDTQIEAPGMLLKHYAPHAELRLYAGTAESVQAAMQSHAAVVRRDGRSFGLLLPDREAGAFRPQPDVQFSLGDTAEEISHRLFDGMRFLDQNGVQVILAHLFNSEGLGLTLNDRLFRAAEGRVIAADDDRM